MMATHFQSKNKCFLNKCYNTNILLNWWQNLPESLRMRPHRSMTVDAKIEFRQIYRVKALHWNSFIIIWPSSYKVLLTFGKWLKLLSSGSGGLVLRPSADRSSRNLNPFAKYISLLTMWTGMRKSTSLNLTSKLTRHGLLELSRLRSLNEFRNRCSLILEIPVSPVQQRSKKCIIGRSLDCYENNAITNILTEIKQKSKNNSISVEERGVKVNVVAINIPQILHLNRKVRIMV